MTRAEEDVLIANALDAAGRPDLAAILRARKKTGRPRKSNEAHNESRADRWEEMADYVDDLLERSPKLQRREAEAAMIAAFMKRPDFIAARKDKESALWDFWDLRGRPEVKAILRARGRILEE